MKRSTICTLMSVMLIFTAFSLRAESKIDPRDPTIWHDDKEAPVPQDVPCQVFSSVVCPAWEDEKSDIQRERERREKRRWYADFEPQ